MSRENYYLRAWNKKWPLPVVPVVHEQINPFLNDGIEMFIVLGYHLPYDTLKFLAVLGMLQDAKETGILTKGDSIVEATSGATGLVLTELALAKPFEAQHVTLIMKEDAPLGKSKPPFLAGAEVLPPHQGLSPIATARNLGGGGWQPNGNWKKSDNGYLNLDQYANPANKNLYRDWCAPRILEQISDFNVLVSPIGTGGTVIGLNEGFRPRLTNFTSVGVMCAPGHEIPGMRDIAGMKEITQPWQNTIDKRIEVDTKPAYLSAEWLNWTMGVTSGVSGGATLSGALLFIKEQKDAGTLDLLRSKNDGKIRVLILIHDGWRPYIIDRFPAFLPLEFQKPSSAPMPWQLLW